MILRRSVILALGWMPLLARGVFSGDLPFEHPTRFRLVINKKTLESLGLIIPAAMLVRAHEVVD